GPSEIHWLANRRIFFDANILIYIFWPTGSHLWEKQYASIFGRLLKQNNEMAVDFIVISEVVNRAVRTEYEIHLQQKNVSKENLPFKKYRDSQDGQDALGDIYQILKKNIINKFNVISKAFTKFDIERFLNRNSLDFSDKGIAAICQENGLVLLTNDKDFAGADLEILSSNPGLLRAS
ncbi:MAG: type II toxin-antitoxin system VapC family toxin, partial [Pseudomonadota bacterium]